MADFRRWITALAVLALFVGLAGAQTGQTGNGQMVCNSVAQVTPALRSEGVTELVGDIVITCTGGSFVAPGAQIPAANIIVNMTLPVTSRLRGSNTSGVDPQASEALLMIDEPNSGLAAIVPGFGPAAQPSVCPSTNGGCPEFAVNSGTTFGGSAVVVATNTAGVVSPGYNVFQGVVNGTQVAFNGVPILPPVTTGIQRVFRITNIRVNASGSNASTVSAFISASPFSSLPISNPTVTVGFVTPSLTTAVSNGSAATTNANVNSFTQCNTALGTIKNSAVNAANVALLSFTEKFPSAFKTRVASASNGSITGGSSYLGTSAAGSYTQNVPGTLYNSESGFIIAANGVNAGLADYGTRFQAVFSGIPAGVNLFVSRYNVTGFTTVATGVAAGTAPTGIGTTATTSIAATTTSTTGGGFANPSGTGSVTTAAGLVDVVPVNNNIAVWEVTNTNPNAVETFTFAVYIQYTPNSNTSQPAPGIGSVTLSYNPIDANPGTLPGTPNTIPRFINLSQAQPILNVVQCQTVLLFPYVTSQGGFDTGIAISNTSMDPLGPTATTTSSGTCTLNFYGAGAPTSPLVVPSSTYPTVLTFANGAATTAVTSPTTIPAGGQIIFTTASVVPNFQGYMFASCNFQFAHGFAFVSDVGARNLAMGYLALVVNNGVPLNTRANNSAAYAGEALEN